MEKSKRLFLKFKRFFHRRLPPIQSGDRIDYRNMSLISRFISEQGKILSRRKQFERSESTTRATGLRTINK
ncbi:hypothetical protein BT93_H3852 [Corymbia citriodora subsp. variegata]|nr:hypothetical protein BT93_H3852 [Corymbia citriodora subsp. variegata]